MEFNRTGGWWLVGPRAGPRQTPTGRAARLSHVRVDANWAQIWGKSASKTGTERTEFRFATACWAVVFGLVDPNGPKRTKWVVVLEFALNTLDEWVGVCFWVHIYWLVWCGNRLADKLNTLNAQITGTY